MKNFLIAIASGLALYTLYLKTQGKRNDARKKEYDAEEDKKIMLYDAPTDRDRRSCHCSDQFCTCGRHLL